MRLVKGSKVYIILLESYSKDGEYHCKIKKKGLKRHINKTDKGENNAG